jgi:hypothetical protein
MVFIVGVCILLRVLSNHKIKPSFATIDKYNFACYMPFDSTDPLQRVVTSIFNILCHKNHLKMATNKIWF